VSIQGDRDKWDQRDTGPDDAAEISLLDMVNFLAQSYQKLLLGAVLGLLLGLASWYLLASYQAQWALHNNTTTSA
jgi:hypothetical protein